MIKYFCDECGKEITYHSHQNNRNPVRPWMDDSLCADCLSLLRSAETEIYEATKHLKEEYVKKIDLEREKILNKFRGKKDERRKEDTGA